MFMLTYRRRHRRALQHQRVGQKPPQPAGRAQGARRPGGAEQVGHLVLEHGVGSRRVYVSPVSRGFSSQWLEPYHDQWLKPTRRERP